MRSCREGKRLQRVSQQVHLAAAATAPDGACNKNWKQGPICQYLLLMSQACTFTLKRKRQYLGMQPHVWFPAVVLATLASLSWAKGTQTRQAEVTAVSPHAKETTSL